MSVQFAGCSGAFHGSFHGFDSTTCHSESQLKSLYHLENRLLQIIGTGCTTFLYACDGCMIDTKERVNNTRPKCGHTSDSWWKGSVSHTPSGDVPTKLLDFEQVQDSTYTLRVLCAKLHKVFSQNEYQS